MGDVVPLGSRLRQRREELGLTQAQAARQLDVARTAYRLWEMEAARPAPDRWRNIAKWLGISMSALLLAEELLDEREVGAASDRSGGDANGWDARPGASEGDFFSQERAAIAEQAWAGTLSAEQASAMHRVLARIQDATAGEEGGRWHPGWFRKRFDNDQFAPALARAALTTTAIGIPSAVFQDALLLVSELVTNSFRHSGSPWVEVALTLDQSVLRVSVSDDSRQAPRPRTATVEGGWGLTLIGELATRWGVDRQAAGKTIWIEFDLPAAT